MLLLMKKTKLLRTSCEQVEEEATVQGIVDKIKLGGEAGLFYLDAQLGARK